MIKSILLENFESHKKTYLEFPSGLTVFVGDTDKGKSGTFRAHQWLTENSPAGDWMLPLFWKGETKVTTVFENPDAVITRGRSKTKNYYQLNNNQPINAGSSVPEEIANIINLDSVNLQTQIERAFLMFETAGERGRILNKIAGLDAIEFTLSNARSDITRLTKAKEVEKEKIREKKKELEQYEDLNQRQEDITKILMMQTALSNSKRKIKNLNKLQEIYQEIENKKELLSSEEKLISLKAKLDNKHSSEKRIDNLKSLLKLCRYVKRKENLENFDGIEDKFKNIKELQNKLEEHNKRIKDLQQLFSDFDLVELKIYEANEEIEHIRNQLPNICIECGRPL